MRRILVVDDIEENLYLLEVLLKQSGYTVDIARNGHQALETAGRNRPDLIITDILMPEMDGFELCREWKNHPELKPVPLIFYTATYTETKDEDFALSLGADLFLRKPMEPDLFLAQIKEVILNIERDPQPAQTPIITDEEESYKLYSERLIRKLEKKMIRLEEEISERRKVEVELRKAKNEWEDTFHAIGSPALLLDREFNILHANRHARKLLESSEDLLIGQKCYQALHDRHTPPHLCPMTRILREGADHHIEKEIEMLGGSYLVNCSPLKNINGEIEKIIHIAVDITDRKNAEKKLKESEEKFRQLVENIIEIFWIRDARDQSIRYVSPMFEKIFKIPAKKWYDDPQLFLELVVDDDKHIVRRSHIDQVEKGRRTDISFRIQINDQIRWIRARGFPVHDENGQIDWVACIAEDISSVHQAAIKQKQLEAQLRHTQKMEAIGTLAGGMAHDFNNILSSIIGYSELSLADLNPDDMTHQNISEVLVAGMRARDLVRQILTLAKKTDDEIKPVIVSKIAEEALKLIRASVPSNIEIIQKLDNNALVLAPPAQIHQVFMNLLTNAAQSIGEEGGTIELRLSEKFLYRSPIPQSVQFMPDHYLKILISDTGTGISNKAVGHIFDPYFTTKAFGKGTGLGLSITHGIVQKHGGYILVDSIVGTGTTFTIFFPITKRQESAYREKPTIVTGTGHILVVDDEDKIINLLVQELKRLGYSVIATTNSTEALEIFKRQRDKIDLVITDMTMPMMTGDQLAAEMKRIEPDTPIILCTGYSRKISDKEASDLGVKAFLMKPISMGELSEIVGKVVGSEKSRQTTQ